MRCCRLLSSPATSQLPFLESPTDETSPMRDPSFPPSTAGDADGTRLSVAEKPNSGGVATASSSSSAPPPAVPLLAVALDGEPVEERSSSCAQTSPRAAIHLREAGGGARGVPVVFPWCHPVFVRMR